ncbi:MAG: MerR family transcriptional regulator [Paenibacillaceae bacterium]|nr:MerR family transcriptional regulator [Paenibacillaceae bacterium]
MMTISQFSERTGLRPKILRYYEEVGLIVPGNRGANGYRQYADSQVETAQLIHSLRQADVSMAGISEFLAATPERKEELLAEWRSMAETKLLSVKIAHQFLQGFDSRTKRMHLVHWENSRTLIWFPVRDDGGSASFAQTAQRIQEKRIAPNETVERAAYLRFPSPESEDREIATEIGFLWENSTRCPEGGRPEKYPPTLFATMACTWEMPNSCKPMLATIKRFQFESVGEPLRKIAFRDETDYTLMIPVLSRGLGKGDEG